MIQGKGKLRKNRDIIIIFMVTVLAMALYPTLGALSLQWLLFPYIVFIPGYCLLLAVYPRNKLGLTKCIALGFGLSFVIVTLVALVQYATKFGSGINPIYTVSGISIIFLIIAYYRRRRRPEAATAPASVNPISRRKLYLYLVPALLLIIFITYQAYALKSATGFSELSVLGPDGMAEAYDTSISLGNSIDLLITVRNNEYATTNYILTTRFDASTISQEQFTLEDQEVWSQVLSFTPKTAGEDKKLRFLLYENTITDEPYQEAFVWVTVKGE